MSDLSLVHRSLGVMHEAPQARPAVLPPAVPGTRELPLDELEIRHLQSTDEIGRVIHLRSEIHLPAAALEDPEFAAREKKETCMVSLQDFSGAGLILEPSASFRWASAWRPARMSC